MRGLDDEFVLIPAIVCARAPDNRTTLSGSTAMRRTKYIFATIEVALLRPKFVWALRPREIDMVFTSTKRAPQLEIRR
jgi:hypothetical protein